ncbi:MAG: DUF3088 family protein [Alphaproteobacteria bacterium]
MTQSCTKDTIFLLAPGFEGDGRREYCPECAEMWGLLSYFPAIKESVNIIYVPIDKPRAAITDLLGEKNQNAPTLILHGDSPQFEDCGIMSYRGQKFINNARDMGKYYAQRYGTPTPRGS